MSKLKIKGSGVLLDIEGTTSSISFVHDVMFPYARRELDRYLTENWDSPELADTCQVIAKDAGFDSLDDWSNATRDVEQLALVRDEVLRLMDGDVKATGLKQLQGLIWKAGFETGEMKAHVYDDVPPALEAWNQAGQDLRIYSSGSIVAQKLFFGHTIVGNLLHLFRGHYDTTIGSKKESASYERIAAAFELPPQEVTFVSDVPAELDAARDAGLRTALCKRPGNAEVPKDHGHTEISDFAQLELV